LTRLFKDDINLNISFLISFPAVLSKLWKDGGFKKRQKNMTRITHSIAGLTIATAYIGATKDFSVVNTIPVLIAGLIGGTFPDIDYFMGDARKNTIWKHRGITHSFLFLVICIAGMFYISKISKYNIMPEIIVFSLAFLSHLFLDSFTFIGLPLFYPLSLKPFYSLKLFKAGSLSEYGFVTIPLIVVLILTAKSVFSAYQISQIFSHGKYFLRRIIY